MAIGRIAWQDRVGNAVHCMAFVALCLFVQATSATEVALAGVMGGKAMLMIDGRGPELVVVGQSISGVRLVSLQGESALVEVDGKKRSLRIGQHVAGSATSGDDKVILTADGSGQFVANGSINGLPMRFLVDTGASSVAIGLNDAKRLGLDLARGQAGIASTANGQVPVTLVKLDSVRVGDIMLSNVDATIHPNDLPVSLLGMSFLNRLEMHREGSTMTLKRRY